MDNLLGRWSAGLSGSGARDLLGAFALAARHQHGRFGCCIGCPFATEISGSESRALATVDESLLHRSGRTRPSTSFQFPGGRFQAAKNIRQIFNPYRWFLTGIQQNRCRTGGLWRCVETDPRLTHGLGLF